MDIVGIARPVKDFIVVVDEIPDRNASAEMIGCSSQGGGKASTALVAAARLGMKCAVMGAVGQDQKGNFVRADFIRHGIDVEHLITREEGETGYCICMSELHVKNRRFIGRRPTAKQISAKELDYNFTGQAKILHLETPDSVSIEAAKFAKEHQILVSMDADPYPDEYDALVEMESLVDFMIGSEQYFTKRAHGKTIRDALYEAAEKGCRIAAATLGENGVEAVIDGVYMKIPAFTNVKVVDTTGAGDVFHGAFLSAWIKGMEPVQCFRFASAVSAIKCGYYGGRAGIPDWKMTEEFLKSGEIIRKEELVNRERYYSDMVV